MPALALRVALIAVACVALAMLATPAAQAYDERPMRLPATGPRAVAASAQPASWLVAAEPGARAAAIAPRFGARRLRSGAVYRVATARARAFAGALRAAGALR
ncbi:MAG: hypothetical protein QOG42_1406, partial [Solirubrobacteraceae bacterium]|nr:hypothetical protein [Solirubrobacteraceae bacterium]